MSDSESMAQAVFEAMTLQSDIVAKATQICKEYSSGRLTRDEWHGLMTTIHYVDCEGDPIKSGWILHECDSLVSQEDWDWSMNEDDKDCQLRIES